MMRNPRLPVHVIAVAALPLVLMACNKAEPAKKADDHRAASGEILEGSASDAMLPIDSVRSQPPLAPKSDSNGGDSKSGKDASDKGGKPAGSAKPKPAASAADAGAAGPGE
ncbi:MAG: hypothetical protein KGL44_00070 [Sphingomonadales bacterium]|nr:hypothetical protein [Sphingomonadales bacterium]